MFAEIKDPAARKAEQQKWLDEQMTSAQSDIAKAMTTRTMFTPLVERTPEEIRRGDEMKKVNDKLLKVNEDQKVILEKRQRDAIEARQEEAQERAKLRPWQPSFYWDFYSRIGSGE
jgi:transcriptional regulator